MCDADLVLASPDRVLAAQALIRAGWKASRSNPHVLAHPGGFLADLHSPSTPLGCAAFGRAVPHPAFRDPRVQWLRPADHLVLLAIHTNQHGGGRLWRDLCDAHLLLPANDSRAAELEAAVREATGAGHGPEIDAFFRLFNGAARPRQPLPGGAEALKGDGSDRNARRADELLAFYRRAALERAPEAALAAVQPFSLSPGTALARLPDLFGRRSQAAAAPDRAEVTLRDPAFRRLPRPKTLGHRLFQARMLAAALLSGRWRHYRLMARGRLAVRGAAKPFA